DAEAFVPLGRVVPKARPRRDAGRMMEGASALADWLETLARERRASDNTVEAYRADLTLFLGFLTRHLGEEPDLAALAALRPADLRAFLAERAREGDGN